MDEDKIYTLSNTKKPSKAGKIILQILLIVTISIATGAAGYYYAQSQTPSSMPDNTTSVNAEKETSTFHSVMSEGYPFDTSKKLTIKLGVPNELQAIKYSSSIQDPGLSASILGDKFNDEMGRWKLGRPTTNDSFFGDISFVNIEEAWLKTASTGNDDSAFVAPYDLPIVSPNMSSAQKQSFLAQLISETEQCTKDGKNSFVIAKTINVCASPYQTKQSLGSYSPSVNLKGYGKIDGLHFVLAGSISLRDDKTYTYDQEVDLQNSFKPDSLPKDTQDILTRYIAALKQTSITLGER